MRRTVVTFLSIGLVIFGISGCSNAGNNFDVTANITEESTESGETKEAEEIETVKEDTAEEASKTEIDKSAVLDAYDKTKADLGKYYYVWDSPKFEIPLLLITDYCVIGEDAELFGHGSAYDCKVYFADPNKGMKVIEIGNMKALSTAYPLAGSDDGLFAASDHNVFQYIPDYKEGKLILWYGFEDNVINTVMEHTGYLKITDGNMEDVEKVDQTQAYDSYYSAEVFSFERTSDVSEPYEFYNLSKEYELEREMYLYAVNLVENGKYRDFEGDIGNILSEYKDIDIDGDGETDTIERFENTNSEYAYSFSFSNGNTLKTPTFSDSPNEGEIIELKDMDGDYKDEILITHYTDGTGGPVAWDVYLYYCNDKNIWEEITIKDEHIQIQDIADVCDFTIGSDYEPMLVSVELTDDGIAMLIDYGSKLGANQIFDLDVFLFDYKNGKLSLSEHSSELVGKYWPKNVEGTY
ncbi:MAG: hypothetical protein K6B28_02340 [Lachnospiraceae bacterium]|nr:hypothetical protein [Lachnospiraceae bacterium]